MKKIIAAGVVAVLLTSTVACEDGPDEGTPVIQTTHKAKKRSKKATPAVEYTCYKNIAGKRVCRRK